MADPQQQLRPGGGVSRATVKKLIKQFAKGAPVRAILPVFDNSSSPALAYQVSVIDAANVIVIRGENLTGITEVDVTTDVWVSGNGGDPPTIVGAPVVLDTSITVTLDGTGDTSVGDKWGIILRDAAGNVYGAPSPINMFPPL